MLKPVKIVLVALSLVSYTQVWAIEDNSIWLNLGGLSYHSDPGYNSLNPGLGLEYNQYAVGIYRNSYNGRSFYAATESNIYKRLNLVSGFASGYPAKVVPLVMPSITYENVRFLYSPKVNIANSHTIAVQFRIRLK
jgi:hypothetical protein